jgi:sugar phosphate isomerase/epimerase
MSNRFSRRAVMGSAAALAAGGLARAAERHSSKSAAHEHAEEVPTGHGAERKFKLGMVTYNFAAEWDLKTLLKRCKAAKIGGIEPRTTHKHGIEPSLSKDERKAVRKQIEDSGIVLWCLGTTCEFHAVETATVQKNIDECKSWIELAHDLGAHCVKVRPNGLQKGVDPKQTLEQIGRSLHTCGEAGKSAGIEVVCVVHGTNTQNPPNMRKIMDVANHPSVGVTWNSNATDVVNGSVKESFQLLRPFLKSCHINNLLSGYPYRELFTLMRETGYDRWTEMEFNPPLDSSSDRDNVLFLSYYRALWEELSKA